MRTQFFSGINSLKISNGILLLAAVMAVCLSPRVALAQTNSNWNGGTGNWSNATDWTPNGVPNNGGGSTYNVTIDSGGTDSAVLDINATINSLVLGGTTGTSTLQNLSGTAETLNIIGTLTVNQTGSLTLSDGSILTVGGNSSNAGAIYLYGSTVTLSGNLNNSGTVELIFYAGTGVANLNVNGNLTNSGSVELSGGNVSLTVTGTFTNDSGATLYTQSDIALGTLVNNGTLQIDSGTLNLTNQPNGITDVGAGSTIQLYGTIKAGANNGLANLATIEGTLGLWNGQALTLNPATLTVSSTGLLDIEYRTGLTVTGTLTNSGTVTVGSGSTLNLDSAGTSASVGVINLGEADYGMSATLEISGGGTLVLDGGAINGTNGTGPSNIGSSTLKATDSTVQLEGGVIIHGGTLTTAAGGVIETLSGQSATLNGVTNSGSFEAMDKSTTTLIGTINNTGTISLNSTGDQTILLIGASSVTLSGKGKVTLSNNLNNIITGTSASDVLTNASTIEGAGNIGNGNMGLVNTGTILADTTTLLEIDVSSAGFDNQGIVQVNTSDTLYITGASNSFLNFNSGNDTLTGGTYVVKGTLKFDGADITTDAANITLSGKKAKITDQSGNNALTTLNTIASTGTFNITSGVTFTTTGSFTNNGSLVVGTTSKFIVDLSDSLTNFNSGTDTLTGGSYNITGTLQFVGANVVNNDASITLTGTKALIENQTAANALTGFNNNESGGAFALATDANFTTSGNFSNAGIVNVGKSTGTGHTQLTISGNYTQTGGTTTVNGLLTASGGINVFGGLVNGNLGTITGNVTVTGGTLSPGDAVNEAGKLNIMGNYSQSGAGILNIDLGGSAADTDVLNISGAAALGGILDVDNIGSYKPVGGHQFVILNYGSETGAFSAVDCSFSNGDGCSITYYATYAVLTITPPPAPNPSLGSVSGTPARWTHSNHLIAAGTGFTREPSAILTPAESCGGFRAFASFACLTKAFSGVTASVGPAARISSGSERASASTFGRLHNNVAAATSGSASRYGASPAPDTRTASAASVARLYVCAYLPSEVASTMGCR